MNLIKVILVTLLLGHFSHAALIVAFGPKKYSPKLLGPSTSSASFSLPDARYGAIFIKNGDGQDLTPRACSGNLIQKALCALENLLLVAKVELERPSLIEVTVNGQLVVTRSNMPQRSVGIVVPVRFNKSNSISVKVGGSFLSHITLEAKAESIAPNVLPVANITADPMTGFAPIAVSLSGIGSYDSDGTILSYDWNFGDGQVASGPYVIHTFNSSGTFNVQLKVTDDKGGVGTSTFSLRFDKNDLPVPVITENLKTDLGDLVVDFDSAGSHDPDGTISEYTWDFGDGSTSSGSRVSHTYFQPGSYGVKLTLRDDRGFYNSLDKVIEVKDSVAPHLTMNLPDSTKIIYTKALPVSVQVNGTSNEKLVQASVAGQSLVLLDDNKMFDGFVSLPVEGENNLTLTALDRWNNSSSSSILLNVIIDSVSPTIEMGSIPVATKEQFVPISFKITDDSPVQTEVKINGQTVTIVAEKEFQYSFNLPMEGENLIEAISTDAAGNSSQVASAKIKRDTTPPVLTFVQPENGDVVSGLQFKVVATSDEPLASASINGILVPLASDLKGISTNFTVEQTGNVNLVFQGTDLAGNSSSQSIEVKSSLKALNPELIGIYPNEADGTLLVRGAVGAVRPNTLVRLKTGLIFSETTTADDRGAFAIYLQPFYKVTVSVVDNVTGGTVSSELTYGTDTYLSGQVRDISDAPLVGVTVRLSTNANVAVSTDSNGVFKFSKNAIPSIDTGDQRLIVDGTTAVIAPGSTPRKYNVSTVNVTIGLGQSNVLQTPIYLTPVYLDGSATEIVAKNGGTVTDVHAPGVSLQIAPLTPVFPNNATSAKISVVTIPANFSTILPPAAAMPKTIVSLEPSGTRFFYPVTLTLPNHNEFPPKTEMVIMLLNSSTGKWEVGGVAAVSDDGQSVVTKEGQGIRHFSQAYATIPSPLVRPLSKGEKGGVNVATGGVKTSVSLPSFKIFGESITPQLSYNSAWANPSATVNALIDFPDRKIEVTGVSRGSTGISVQVDVPYCFLGRCTKRVQSFFQDVQYESQYKDLVAKVQPQKIDAQFRSGNIVGPKITYDGGPNSALKNGSMFSFYQDISGRNPNQLLNSGVHPYNVHFDIKYKELTLGSVTTTYTAAGLEPKVTSQEIHREHQGLFATDLNGSLVVQNHSKSNTGKGWILNGNQRLLNISGPRIVIEEASGETSTYVANDTISTILDGAAKNLDLTKGNDLVGWPEIEAVGKSGDEIVHFNSTLTETSRVKVPTFYSGVYYAVNQFREHGQFNATCYRESYNHVVPVNFSSIAKVGGNIVYTDLDSHLVAVKNSSNARIRLVGDYGQMTTRQWTYTQGQPPGYIRVPYDAFSPTNLTNCTTNGSSCTRTSAVYDPTQVSSCFTSVPTSTGFYPRVGSAIREGQQQLNGPTAVIKGRNANEIIFADGGNRRVRAYDMVTGVVTLVAGSGAGGDNGLWTTLATKAAYSRPRALMLDSKMNIFVATEGGYIRKIKPDGYNEYIAGNPTGELSDSGITDKAKLNLPTGMALDKSENYLYVADTGNHRVLKFDLKNGRYETVAGNGAAGFSGDQRAALSASLNSPTNLKVDSEDNLIIVDAGNNRLRKVTFGSAGGLRLSYTSESDDNSRLQADENSNWDRTYRDGRVVKFDARGLQTSQTDRLGRGSVNSYDNLNRLIQTQYSNGQSISYEYNGAYLSAITDPAGRTTRFFHDSNGHLTRVLYSNNAEREFEYDTLGLLKVEEGLRGEKTSYVYNEFNRVHKVQKANGYVLTVNDITSSNLKNFVNGEASALKNQGDSENDLNDSYVDPSGLPITVSNDFQGIPSSFKDQRGNISTYYRDDKGRVVQHLTRDINGTVRMNIKYTLDPVTGDQVKIEDLVNGKSKNRSFDSLGNILNEQDFIGGILRNVYITENGLLQTSTLPSGQRWVYTYNNLGFISTSTHVDRSGAEQKTIYEYDSLGRIFRTTDFNESVREYEYDQAGNVIVLRSGKIGSLKQTSYKYNQFNQVIEAQNPKNETTKYEYSLAGDLTKITLPNSKTETMDYDVFGRMISKTNALGKSRTYEYDNSDNLVRETDPKGQAFNYEYDVFNKLKVATLPDDVISYGYDSFGRVNVIQNKNSLIGYTTDFEGKIIQESWVGVGALSTNQASVTSFSYDPRGILASSNHNGIIANYLYDAIGRLGELNSGGSVFRYAYDQKDRLTSIKNGSADSQFSYGPNGLVAGVEHFVSDVKVDFTNYQFNSNEVINERRSPAGISSYAYDSNNQLESESGIENSTFTYDSRGNRTSDSGRNFTYDSASELLMDDGLNTYAYDENGNMIQKTPKDSTKEAWVYSYSSKNQLIEATKVKSVLGEAIQRVTFHYDAVGRRVQKVVWNKDAASTVARYAYEGENIKLVRDGNNQILISYLHNSLSSDDVLEMIVTQEGVNSGVASSVGKYRLMRDAQGSVTSILRPDSTVAQKYQYTAFGNVKITDNANEILATPVVKNVFLFTGKEFDSETGLYYYRARYYTPEIGRFLQRDPHPGDVANSKSINNGYSYVGNNPAMYRDPSGKIAWFIAIPLMGAIGGALYGGIINGLTGQDIWTGVWQGALGGLATGIGTATGIFFAGGAAAIGSMAGLLGGGLGGGLVGGLLGAYMSRDSNPTLGFFVGFTFGFIAGAVSGGISMSGQGGAVTDGVTNTVLNAPPIEIPKASTPVVAPVAPPRQVPTPLPPSTSPPLLTLP